MKRFNPMTGVNRAVLALLGKTSETLGSNLPAILVGDQRAALVKGGGRHG